MIEHAAWRGTDYCKTGIDGQRIAIVGYSHWHSAGEEDRPEKTNEIVGRVVSGEYKIQFFTQIRNYFSYADHESFWHRVLFFNFLPNFVGDPNDRYSHGTEEQRSLGRARFARIIREEQPNKLFIFTSRHWVFGDAMGRSQFDQISPKFSWRAYDVEGHSAKAFFLRHPQGASRALMRRAVECIMNSGEARTEPDVCIN
jgi:hypothetical protein